MTLDNFSTLNLNLASIVLNIQHERVNVALVLLLLITGLLVERVKVALVLLLLITRLMVGYLSEQTVKY
jgi:hypothetical protein